MNDKPRENLWKVVVNGNAGAGKTSMLVRFVEGSFEASRTSVTIQGEYLVKEMKRFENTGKDIRLQVFDTAGQEKFRYLTPRASLFLVYFYIISLLLLFCFEERNVFIDLSWFVFLLL